MNLENKKALVVGGAGFIGSHVADELARLGAQVTVYDIQKTPHLHANYKFISGDLNDQAALDKATQGQDIVYHFAAIADIGEASEKRIETIRTNIMGSVNLIEACLKNKVKTFVFASSIYVYSNKGSFYRITKQTVESLLEEYARLYKFNYRILRYGSLYGPRSQGWNGLRKYVSQALTKGRVELKSKGLAKREYIHVQDAARMSVEALADKYANNSLVISGNQSITAEELIKTLAEMLDKEIKIDFSDSVTNDHYVMTPYKYTPKIGLKLTSPDFVDFGQGLLELIAEVSEETGAHHKK